MSSNTNVRNISPQINWQSYSLSPLKIGPQNLTDSYVTSATLKPISFNYRQLSNEFSPMIFTEYRPGVDETLWSIANKLAPYSLNYTSVDRFHFYLATNIGNEGLKKAIRTNGTILIPPCTRQPDYFSYAYNLKPFTSTEKDHCLHIAVSTYIDEKRYWSIIDQAKASGITSLMFDIKDEGNDDRARAKIMWAKLIGYARKSGIEHIGARVVLFRNAGGYVNPQESPEYITKMVDLVGQIADLKMFDFIALDYLRFSENLPRVYDQSRINFIGNQVFLPILKILKQKNFSGELQVFIFGDSSRLVESTIRNIGQDPRVLKSIYDTYDPPPPVDNSFYAQFTKKIDQLVHKNSQISWKKGFGLCFKTMAYGGTHSSQDTMAFPVKDGEFIEQYTGSKKSHFSASDPIMSNPAQANALYSFPLCNLLVGTGIRFETSVLGNDYLGTISKYGINYLLVQCVVSMLMGNGTTFFNPQNLNTTLAASRLSMDFYNDNPDLFNGKRKLSGPIEDEIATWLEKNRPKYYAKYPSIYPTITKSSIQKSPKRLIAQNSSGPASISSY